ncbi:uncharacterized protein EI97DRAFT_454533 [Westerdykella ornata]|uniref:C2H2-type domain-containing protein n=1 Tax=Westerdykella ornata TaxID=318751 RepID=A0A6A6JY41_WESOR|nr:uncharacterized protein EI97DRAFT_454533 [Westerdykella ornata]KAF2281327.1 hypothetical protein EI97DRAFT_454533 [Westerdykella ornata]
MDGSFSELLPWDRAQIKYSPLNSHLPFNEGVGEELCKTEEELEQVAQQRKLRAAERMVEISKQAYERERAKAKNSKKSKQYSATTRARAKESKRFYCDICDVALQSNPTLNKHLASQAHATQEELRAGGTTAPPSKETLHKRDYVAKIKESKKYYCPVCDYSIPRGSTAFELLIHTRGPTSESAAADHDMMMPSPSTLISLFILTLRFSTASPVANEATALPQLIPGPGLPTLESLNLTMADLLAMDLPDFPSPSPSPSLSANPRSPLHCATHPARFTSPLEIRTCYGYLITAGTRMCGVPARKPDELLVGVFCQYGDTLIAGISLTGNAEASYCRDVAKAVASITEQCARPQDGWVAGYNTAHGNGNLEVGVGKA